LFIFRERERERERESIREEEEWYPATALGTGTKRFRCELCRSEQM
jgi:hypothetical protein